MSQRDSGYARIERDAYETPEWVTEALVKYISGVERIWEPASGTGKMKNALRASGFNVIGTDIVDGQNFFHFTDCMIFLDGTDAIVTNPPYDCATEFIEHALSLGVPIVAMLLRTDFDHAKTRQHLFGKCPRFSKKIVLLKRIRWIEGSTGSPSFNHAWFIWDWQNNGRPPTIAYQ